MAYRGFLLLPAVVDPVGIRESISTHDSCPSIPATDFLCGATGPHRRHPVADERQGGASRSGSVFHEPDQDDHRDEGRTSGPRCPRGFLDRFSAMILLHRFQEPVTAAEPVVAGTATFTRTRSESNDQDPFFLAKTKTATMVRAEAPDTDHSATSGRIFPPQCDPDYHQQG